MFDERRVTYVVIIHRERIESPRQDTYKLVSDGVADGDQVDFQFRQHFAQFFAPTHLLIR